MTDITDTAGLPVRDRNVHTGEAAKARLRARYAAERRFKWMGAGALGVSAIFLVLLLSTIVMEAFPAFRASYLVLPLDLSASKVDPADTGAANYDEIVQEALLAKFPQAESRQDRRLARGLVSTGAGVVLRRAVQAGDVPLGATIDYGVPLDDFADLYMKGLVASSGSTGPVDAVVTPSAT